MGFSCEGKERHPFIHIGAACLHVTRQVALAAIDLVAPLKRHPAIEVVGDRPVQLIHIDTFQAVAQAIDFRAQAGDRLIMVTLLNGVTVAERLNDELIYVIAEPQPCQNVRELLFEDLLPHEALRAFPVISGAMIIDVFALLHLGGQRATAVPAGDQTGEREILDAATCPGVAHLVAPIEDVLSALPQVHGDERLVATFVYLSQPFEIAGVEATAQYLVDGADGNGAAAFAIDKASLARQRADFLQRIIAGGIPLEHAGDDRPLVGIDHDDLLAVGFDDIAVSERRGARPEALLRLFQHPLADFFGEIVDVVLRHQHLDAVHELLGRARFPRQNHAFLHEVDFGVQFVDRHPVLEIAVEPIGLLDQDRVDGFSFSQKPDHFVETGTAALLGGFDIDIFAGDDEPVGGSVLAKQL